jgi:hypothetical protein
MATSAHASLTFIDGRSPADHFAAVVKLSPGEREGSTRSFRNARSGQGKAFTGGASSSTLQPSGLADYIILSALWLLAAVEIWRRLKDGIFNPYRPELHYMRGPGPKYREKHAQEHAV